jgi:hypothetical protein
VVEVVGNLTVNVTVMMLSQPAALISVSLYVPAVVKTLLFNIYDCPLHIEATILLAVEVPTFKSTLTVLSQPLARFRTDVYNPDAVTVLPSANKYPLPSHIEALINVSDGLSNTSDTVLLSIVSTRFQIRTLYSPASVDDVGEINSVLSVLPANTLPFLNHW